MADQVASWAHSILPVGVKATWDRHSPWSRVEIQVGVCCSKLDVGHQNHNTNNSNEKHAATALKGGKGPWWTLD